MLDQLNLKPISHGKLFELLSYWGDCEQDKLLENHLLEVTLNNELNNSKKQKIFGKEPSKVTVNSDVGVTDGFIKIKFPKHKIKLERLSIRLNTTDSTRIISKDFTIKSIVEFYDPLTEIHSSTKSVKDFHYDFSREKPFAKDLQINMDHYANVIKIEFSNDFCIEHIIFEG